MGPAETPFRTALERLRALVLERLIELLEQGVPVQKPDAKTGRVIEMGRAPAPPAYLSAAIRFLKDNGAVVAVDGADELSGLLDDLPCFDHDEDDLEDG